ncbi:MAG TPA: hypothetical protein VII45_13655 [Solirubrobacterales bacterium]
MALGAALAHGERAQKEDLIVSLSGGITPRKLPRDRPAPVAVHLAGGIETSDGSPLPRVNWIKLELAWRGRLFTRGLPVCPRARLKSTDSPHAILACPGALVGHGRLFAKIFVPNQVPFGIHARLLAFNGRTHAGRPAVWVHAYSADPPVSFVLPFTVRHQPGAFRTVLVTTIRRSVGPWPHVANFQITIARNFSYRGKRRSYLTASCPVPRNFTAGFLSFARANYTFADGRQLRPQVVRSCRAR